MSAEQRVAIVTGAARGLGRAMALGLLESGLAVVAVCRPRSGGEEAVPPFPEGRWVRVDGDVTNPEDCARAVSTAQAAFGRVDVLVNNAAIAHDPFPKVHDTDFVDVEPEVWRRIVDVNVTGPFLMARAVVPHLVVQGWGRVVNLSTSRFTMLMAGVLPYGPTKAALGALTVGWSAHLAGTGVTVNEVLPGGPAGQNEAPKHWRRPGQRSWSAGVMVPPVRWLASEASDGVTGRRFVARLWDPSLPDAEAAAASGFPAGLPLNEEDYSREPEA